MAHYRWIVATLLALGWAGSGHANTFHVYPGESIQAAINIAIDGDEIVVHPGTYGGTLHIGGKAIYLHSSDGAAVTTLSGQQSVTVIQCQTGEGLDTVLEGFTISLGQGAPNGGGMYLVDAGPTVRNCVFRDNHAQYGGAVFANPGWPTFQNCTFEQNEATASAGAVYCMGYGGTAAATLLDCRFESNHAYSSGGAMRNWDSSPTLVRCVFVNNHTRYGGGAVANGGTCLATYTDCVFDGNSADTLFGNWDSFGGGVHNTDTSAPVLVNCLFVANSAVAMYPYLSRGGALANSGSATPRLTNCSVLANHANSGNALWITSTAQVTIANSILWNDGNEIVNDGTAPTVIRYSDVQGGWPGTGNINLDPRLDDHHLQADSPCINTGDPAYAPLLGRDLDGHARVLGGRVDMGSYEFGIGDYTGDRVVDAQDFIAGAACMTGPDYGPYASGCEALDFEYDLDVDLVDLAALQALISE